MTQEEKGLLLKDLCARLPYGVIVKVSKEDNGSIKSYNKPFDVEIYNLLLLNGWYKERGIIYHYSQFSLKPYLRPMSSMTEEEKEYLKNNFRFYFDECSDGITNGIYSFVFNRTIYQMINEDDISNIIDWLNAHHFDYRGLIEKGLAIAVTEENNPYKE